MNDTGMNDQEQTADELRAIAFQVRRWLDWHKQSRSAENLVTLGDTTIMALPVPFWPTHGMFEAWIAVFEAAADSLSSEQGEPK